MNKYRDFSDMLSLVMKNVAMYKRLLALCLIPLASAACGQEQVSCSSDKTKEIIQDIAKKQVRNSPWAYWINPEETKIKLERIITRNSSDRSAECEAHLEYDLSTKSEFQDVQSPFGNLKPYEFEAKLEENQASEVQYKVDRTDDGKQLLVKMTGIKPWR